MVIQHLNAPSVTQRRLSETSKSSQLPNVVDFYQIYYNEETKMHCSPLCKLVDNSGSTNEPFFENHVIQRLAPNFEDNAMCAVLSWKYKSKLTSGVEALHKRALNTKADIVLHGVVGNHWIAAEKWHPNFKNAALLALEAAGLPTKWYSGKAYTCHFNYQVVRGRLYKKYVVEALTPFMNAFEQLHVYEAASKNAGYRSLAKFDSERLQIITGFPYYPHHPFLAERLFGSWAYYLGARVERY